MRLQNKVALVSGSSVGIGEAIAKRFATEGADIAVNYKTNDEAANNVVAEIVKSGGKAKAFKEARKSGKEIEGLNDWNIRWVGKEGYKGIVARQLQEFKQAQTARKIEEQK